jgi:predicted DNA-binding protein
MAKKKEGKKKSKKDSQLLIRINGERRDRFVSLCEELDTSAAREIRKFIEGFIKEHRDPEGS